MSKKYVYSRFNSYKQPSNINAQPVYKNQQFQNINNNLFYSVKISNYFKFSLINWVLTQKITLLALWGNNTPYVKTMIIRGIGYRAFCIKNDLSNHEVNKDLMYRPTNSMNAAYVEWQPDLETPQTSIEQMGSDSIKNWSDTCLEFIYSRYLVIRAGHTVDKYIPLLPSIHIKTIKRDRKLVIYGLNKRNISTLSKIIKNYRGPSVYTGRGIRQKYIKPIRKAGKRDKQKGRAF